MTRTMGALSPSWAAQQVSSAALPANRSPWSSPVAGEQVRRRSAGRAAVSSPVLPPPAGNWWGHMSPASGFPRDGDTAPNGLVGTSRLAFERPETSRNVLPGTGGPVGNERLRAALAVNGMTTAELATKVDVDPKTVERWISSGRIPHARHRRATAICLGQDEGLLWPDTLPTHRVVEASRSELLGVYPHRSDAPTELWWSLFDGARDQIAYVAYAALFLFETHPDLVDLLGAKASAGCQVRVALGEPTSEAVRQRGEDEHFGEGIESRVNLALKHIEPVRRGTGVEVRLHSTTLYNSIYRFDDQLLVNTHLWGVNAYEAPLLHLRRVEGAKLFDVYARNLEQIWATAGPIPAERT